MSMNLSMHKPRPCSQSQVVERYITSCGANVTTTRPGHLSQVLVRTTVPIHEINVSK